MTARSLGKRISQLEHWIAPAREHRVVVRYQGPGNEKMQQPTKEELAEASHVITIQLVPAKDGRPAAPEEIATGDTSDGK